MAHELTPVPHTPQSHETGSDGGIIGQFARDYIDSKIKPLERKVGGKDLSSVLEHGKDPRVGRVRRVAHALTLHERRVRRTDAQIQRLRDYKEMRVAAEGGDYTRLAPELPSVVYNLLRSAVFETHQPDGRSSNAVADYRQAQALALVYANSGVDPEGRLLVEDVRRSALRNGWNLAILNAPSVVRK